MIKRKLIQKVQAEYAMENGEFDKDVIGSEGKVVVILTQDWCPQWLDIKDWVYNIDIDGEDIDIYEFEYNKSEIFNTFMNFKENKWNNYSIPYLRFYHNGRLVKETNYIDQAKFMDFLA